MLEQNPFGLVTRTTGGMLNGATPTEDKKAVLDWQSQENTNILNRFSDKVSALPDEGLQSVKDKENLPVVTPVDDASLIDRTPDGKMLIGANGWERFGDKDKVIDYIDKLRTNRQAKDIYEAIANPSFEYQPKNLAEAAALGQARVQAGLVKEEKTAWQRTVELAKQNADAKMNAKNDVAPEHDINAAPGMATLDFAPEVRDAFVKMYGQQYAQYSKSIDDKSKLALTQHDLNRPNVNLQLLEETRAADEKAVADLQLHPNNKLPSWQTQRIQKRSEYDAWKTGRNDISSRSTQLKNNFFASADTQNFIKTVGELQRIANEGNRTIVSTGMKRASESGSRILENQKSGVLSDGEDYQNMINSGSGKTASNALDRDLAIIDSVKDEEWTKAATRLSEIAKESPEVFKSEKELADSIDNTSVSRIKGSNMKALRGFNSKDQLDEYIASSKISNEEAGAMRREFAKSEMQNLVEKMNEKRAYYTNQIEQNASWALDNIKNDLASGDVSFLTISGDQYDGSSTALSAETVASKVQQNFYARIAQELGLDPSAVQALAGKMPMDVKRSLATISSNISDKIHTANFKNEIIDKTQRQEVFPNSQYKDTAINVKPPSGSTVAYVTVTDTANKPVQLNQIDSAQLGNTIERLSAYPEFLASRKITIENRKIGNANATVYSITPEGARELNNVIIPRLTGFDPNLHSSVIHASAILGGFNSSVEPTKDHPYVIKMVAGDSDSAAKFDELAGVSPGSGTERKLPPNIQSVLNSDPELMKLWATTGDDGIPARRLALAAAAEKFLVERTGDIKDIYIKSLDGLSRTVSEYLGYPAAESMWKELSEIERDYPREDQLAIKQQKYDAVLDKISSNIHTITQTFLDRNLYDTADLRLSMTPFQIEVRKADKTYAETKKLMSTDAALSPNMSKANEYIRRQKKIVDVMDKLANMIREKELTPRAKPYVKTSDKASDLADAYTSPTFGI